MGTLDAAVRHFWAPDVLGGLVAQVVPVEDGFAVEMRDPRDPSVPVLRQLIDRSQVVAGPKAMADHLSQILEGMRVALSSPYHRFPSSPAADEMAYFGVA